MEQLTRSDIKEIITEAIKPILVEIKASDNAHNTEIERLTKQSGEHYENYKQLEEKMTKQVRYCQKETGESQEKAGERVGTLEQSVVRLDEHVQQNTKEIEAMKANKQFNLTQWIAVVGIAVLVIFEIIPFIGS